jgi:hypothetical protein
MYAHALAHSVAGRRAQAAPPPALGGLPADRGTLAAAQRAFAQLKLSCMAALAHVPTERHPWLHREVHRAEEPLDLWMLRAPLLAALLGSKPELKHQRQLLRRALEAVFGDDGGPETAYDSAVAPL